MKDVKARTVFVPSHRERSELDKRIVEAGLRPTLQRRVVFGALLDTPDHPTADEIFLRAKHAKPNISMATVYNCLDALQKCNLVKQVNMDRSATRYCPNMHEHAHFQCEECGEVTDFDGAAKTESAGIKVPPGYKVHHVEMSIRGLCSDCAEKSN